MMLTNRQIRIRLFESLKNSFFRKTVGISFVLLLILLITAFSLIVVRFEYKLQLNQQKELIAEDSKLDEEWSQIVLEYSPLAAPTAVEKFAEKEKMSLPKKKDLRFLNEQDEDSNNE